MRMWSQITCIDQKLQPEVVVYNMDGHPSGKKEKIQAGIGSNLEGNERQIEELINFYDIIFLQKEMSERWTK